MHEVFGIVTLASALLIGPSLASHQFGDGQLMGPFGRAVGAALNYSVGLAGYLLVLVLLLTSIRIFAGGLGLERPERQTREWGGRVGLLLLTGAGAALLHLGTRPTRIHGASTGGVLGEVAGELLCSVVSTAGAWVIALAALALAMVLATNLSWARAGLLVLRALRAALARLPALVERSRRHLGSMALGIAHALRRRELCAEPGGAAMLPPVVRLDLGGELALQAPARPATEPEEQAQELPLPRDLEIGGETTALPELIFDIDVEEEQPVAPASSPAPAPPDISFEAASTTLAQSPVLEIGPAEPLIEESPAGLTIVQPQFRDQPISEAEAASDEKHVELGDGPGFVLHSDVYRPPPLSLLEYEETAESRIDHEAIYRQAERLVKTLADYKIEGRVTEVHPGPVVTMYEFVPAPGTRISKIANLANDLAMSLAAQRVRIVAPIPGKGAVGIEVPNDRRETVFFKEIVAHDSFRKSKAALALALGKNIVGAPVTVDLAKMPHLLVAGATGAGKSVSINAMICSLLLRATPEDVRLIMVDPKYLELSGYNDIPHLLLPVVTDPKKANIALRWAVNEMERRYQLLADMRVRDIVAYNRKVEKLQRDAEETAAAAPVEPAPVSAAPVEEAPPSKILVVRKNEDGTEEPVLGVAAPPAPDLEGPPAPISEPESDDGESDDAERDRRTGPLPRHLPYIVVVIDEFADLMMVASKDVETSVARLAQKARAAGIHVILATQRPSVDVITGLIKANFPSRISFQVASTHDSKTILNVQGAENLLGSGDMLILDRGAEMKRIHGAYISDREIRRMVDWLKEQGRPVYDMDILKPPEDEETAPEIEEASDEMYDQAVALVLETRQASISMIQRRLRVGYNRAARMVERMEKEGLVSAPDGIKGREVLVQQPYNV